MQKLSYPFFAFCESCPVFWEMGAVWVGPPAHTFEPHKLLLKSQRKIFLSNPSIMKTLTQIRLTLPLTSKIVVSLMAVFLLLCIQSCTPTLLLNRSSGPVELNKDVDLRAQTMGFKASEGSVEILWYVNGNQVATGENYLFSTTEPGQYVIRAEAAQRGNKAQAQIALDAGSVTSPLPPPSPAKFTLAQQAMLNKCMGKGYRAEQDYADLSDVTLALFDQSQLEKYTNLQLTGKFEEGIIEGNTVEEYSDKLSVGVSVGGGVGLFSASVSTSFNSEGYQSSENSFYTMKKIYHYYRLDVDTQNAPLRPSVKNDLDHMAPDQLFDKYGTHFIQSAFIGARIAFNTYIDKSKFSNSTNFSADVKASYGAVSGDGSVETKNSSSISTFNSNSILQVFGGDPILAEKVAKGGGDQQEFAEWYASTKSDDGHTLADFGYQGLQPIYSLASTQARKDILKAEMEKYLIAKGTPLPQPKVIVKKNSTFILQSKDSRYVTRPVLKLLPWPASSFYYPLVLNDRNTAGLFTFIPTSSAALKDGDNVTIRFTDNELRNNEGQPEPNADFLKKRFLKIGGIAPMAHYWDQNSEANWIVRKVDRNTGTSIFDGEEVYIQHDVTKKYLTIYNSGGTALWVQESQKINGGSRDDAFVWQIRLASKN